MAVHFTGIQVGGRYSRPTLAEMWGYKGYQAIARGVVTPQRTDLIILFVTEDKQNCVEQYADWLTGNLLHWEGPTDHYAEKRMIQSPETTDEIHIFHRARHHTDFEYLGRAIVQSYTLHADRPSQFELLLEEAY